MDINDECRPGRRATVTVEVTEADTALALGSGEVRVLATPRLLALAEQASMKALGDCLPEGKTSVGSHVDLEHKLPSSVGAVVSAEAVLLGVHGRRLEFFISVRDDQHDGEEIAHIRHRRVLVSRARFDPPGGAQDRAPDEVSAPSGAGSAGAS